MSYIIVENKKYVTTPEVEFDDCTGCVFAPKRDSEGICSIDNDKEVTLKCGIGNVIYKEHFIEVFKRL